MRFWLAFILLVGVALPAAAETREVRLTARETVTAE
jgi:hypothetical protein